MQRYIHSFFFLAHLPITFEISLCGSYNSEKHLGKYTPTHVDIYIHWFPLKHRYPNDHSLL
jgi:hypothetical protein